MACAKCGGARRLIQLGYPDQFELCQRDFQHWQEFLNKHPLPEFHTEKWESRGKWDVGKRWENGAWIEAFKLFLTKGDA